MKYISYLHILLISIALLFVSLPLEATGTTGTSGADFLELAIGSRALGMGEAFTAQTNDLSALYFNPASLGTMKYPMLELFHHELLLDSRLEHVSFCYPIDDGFLGIANSLFWVPPFEKVDINGLPNGEVNFFNGVFTAAYGYNFGYFYLGASFKYVYQRIDTLFLHAFAMDIGIMKGMRMWTPFKAPMRNFHVGLSVLNLGSKVKGSPLPRTIRLGLSYRLLNWLGLNIDMSENCIESSDLYDFTQGFNESFRLNIGMELSYNELLYLRGGWRFNDAGTYTVGMGVNFVVKNVTFTIDASFADAGDFNPTYSFNIAFKLIPRVITIQDKRNAEKHYLRGIKAYVADDIDSALREFKTTRDYNPYHKHIKKKIRDLEELEKLKKMDEKAQREEDKNEE